MKVGNTKALNKCDLSSQHVTPTTLPFLKVPIKAFMLVILHLLLDDSKQHVNKNQSRGICTHRLSHIDPCLGKVLVGLISLCCSQISLF